MLIRCLRRELRWCFYHRLSIFNALLFLLIIASLFPMTISPDPKLLRSIGPGVIWVAAMLAMLLSMQHFFKEDYQDGSLDYLCDTLTYYVIAKVIVHWLWLVLPIILLTPLVSLFYQLNIQTTLLLVISLLLGTPSLMLIAAVLAALTVTLRQNSLLILLMALPLYIPILIFGAAASLTGIVVPLSFLTALLILLITILPLLTVKILKCTLQV